MPDKKTATGTSAIYVFFGMIATGKSSVAQAWSWHKKIRCYNSDWIRKEMAGLDPTQSRHESVDKGIYTKDFSNKTYATLLERAEARLKINNSVILDASYQYARDRQAVRDLASRMGCPSYFIFCQCPETVMKNRMDARENDPAAVSDGTWNIYLEQKKRFEPPAELQPSELFSLDTSSPLEDLLEELIDRLP